MNTIKTLAARAALAATLVLALGAAQAAGPAKSLSKAQIPAGFAVGSGKPPLSLRVELADGKARSASVAAATPGNVTASGSSDAEQTMLTIRHDLDVALKFDLYVSSDGERFEYASSCAVTPGISSFEMWSRPIRAFALGNPRVVDAGRMACD
ncbi:hypothetical protein [Lysobacter silvisoli]|uniref:Uncharacterized protein n=1 Tax=Lysobacter silvisoli TaxID=2293254 RepID=A0A371JZI5_9GAMM|nr:hypothetical protein [Lysobacter silvisoli]RDZ27083.1 hypothetical protein DX914_12520 [Lysobacter silvisoli]